MKNSKVNKQKNGQKEHFTEETSRLIIMGTFLSKSPTIKKMQTKAIIKYHLTLNRLANESCLTTTSNNKSFSKIVL